MLPLRYLGGLMKDLYFELVSNNGFISESDLNIEEHACFIINNVI